MKWKRIEQGKKVTVPARIVGGKGYGWTTTKMKENGVLVALDAGEDAAFLSDKFLEEKGFVLKEYVNDSLDYFQGRTITPKLIDEFWEDMSLVEEGKSETD